MTLPLNSCNLSSTDQGKTLVGHNDTTQLKKQPHTWSLMRYSLVGRVRGFCRETTTQNVWTKRCMCALSQDGLSEFISHEVIFLTSSAVSDLSEFISQSHLTSFISHEFVCCSFISHEVIFLTSSAVSDLSEFISHKAILLASSAMSLFVVHLSAMRSSF